jgi:hypothetical protein
MALMMVVLFAQAVYWVYPAPGVIANGPAPMFANAEDAARCEDALWVDEKGLPSKTVSESRYKSARTVCDKAQDSLEPGVRVTVEGQFILNSSSLAAFRVQGLVVRSIAKSDGLYVAVEDFWIPANRVQVFTSKVTTKAEQDAEWRRLVGKH